jgi:hypothetical protein
MQNLLIKSESLSTHCEICRQSDCYDPLRNHCSRCSSLYEVTEVVIPKKRRSLDSGEIGTICGAIAGALIGLLGEAIGRMFLIQTSVFFVTLGLTIFGAILGAIAGSGVERLRKIDSN